MPIFVKELKHAAPDLNIAQKKGNSSQNTDMYHVRLI